MLAKSASEMKALRQEMQIIFQDPVGSLNPRMTVGKIIGEPIVVHGIARAGSCATASPRS
ncbi:MAG: hypothetical protein R3C45_03125 [Phycisphaerales bacterium]